MTERVSRLVEDLRSAEGDAEALATVLDVLEQELPALSADEARPLHDAVARAVQTVRERRDALRAKLGGIRTRSRAVRGFGRAVRDPALLRGQRVNTDV